MPLRREPLPPSDRIAVVVGVPCHRGEGIPPLAYATRDASRVADLLEGSGYTVDRLLTVVDRSDLDAALDRAEAALSPGGSLIVYFSGHGVLREDGGRLARYLVLSDTDLSSVRGTAMSVLTLDERVSRIDARARVVVQDTCFAARPGGKSLGLPSDGHTKGLAPAEPGLALRAGDARLYASRFFEQAVESPEHRGSIYTHYLLEALASDAADLDGDGCVGLLEAHAWARDATEAERGGFQTPQLRSGGVDNVLLGCEPAPPTRAVVQPPRDEAWSIELRTRDGALVRRGAGAVPPGRYQVSIGELQDTSDGEVARETLFDAPMRLAAGQWLDLDDEVARRAPVVLLEGSGGWRAPGTLPSVTAGAGLWRGGRDLGRGRPALGLDGQYGSGDLPDAQPGRLSSVDLQGRVAWWWERRIGQAELGGGPQLGAGPSIAMPAGNRAVAGWTFAPGARLHLLLDPLVLSVEGSARILPLILDSGPRTEVLPSIRIGLGVRL